MTKSHLLALALVLVLMFTHDTASVRFVPVNAAVHAEIGEGFR